MTIMSTGGGRFQFLDCLSRLVVFGFGITIELDHTIYVANNLILLTQKIQASAGLVSNIFGLEEEHVLFSCFYCHKKWHYVIAANYCP